MKTLDLQLSPSRTSQNTFYGLVTDAADLWQPVTDPPAQADPLSGYTPLDVPRLKRERRVIQT